MPPHTTAYDHVSLRITAHHRALSYHTPCASHHPIRPKLVAQMSGNCAATSHNAREVAGHRGDAHAHDLASAGHAAEHTTAAFEHSFGVCLKRNLSTSILTDLVMPFPQTQAAVCLWVVDKLLEDCKVRKKMCSSEQKYRS